MYVSHVISEVGGRKWARASFPDRAANKGNYELVL